MAAALPQGWLSNFTSSLPLQEAAEKFLSAQDVQGLVSGRRTEQNSLEVV